MGAYISTLRKKSMVVSGLIVVVSALWWTISAVSNIDTMIQHTGHLARLLNFTLSQRGTQIILTLSLVAFVVAVFAEKWRENAPKDAESAKEVEGLNDRIKQLEQENMQHQATIASLETQHGKEIAGRIRAFDYLQRSHDLLKERLEGWERYAWVAAIADSQVDEIDKYVTLEQLSLHDVQLNNSVPSVRFDLHILNSSVFDIYVELETDNNSYVIFGDLELREKFFGIPSGVLHVPRQKEGCLTIEQRLSRPEADHLAASASKDGIWFYFDRLVLTIKGSNRYPIVEPKRLFMNKGVTIHNESLTVRR